METLQFILIGLLIVSNVLLFRKSYYQLKAMETLDETDNNIYENIKAHNKRVEQLFNTIDTQVQDNQSFKNEIMDIVERKSEATNKWITSELEVIEDRLKSTQEEVDDNTAVIKNKFDEVTSIFKKVDTRINQSNAQLENYAIINDMDLTKIMDRVNSIEEEQVELSHSFDTMLTSLADVKTAEFLDNLGYSHETE